MHRERFEQIDRIFRSALERPAEERAAFVEEACAGDTALRREVESLISHDASGDFMGPPVFEEATRLLAAEGPQGPGPGDVFGQYEIVERVGAGGMGVVYRALDTRLGRAVALKMLPGEYTRDADRLQRFEREARAASALNHPNILTVHEIGEHDGAHYIATEYVEGETLRQLRARGPVAPAEAARIAAQVADALEVAHERGIIHRDIKPENIMLRRRDQIVKVLDFGLAKLTEQARHGEYAHPSPAPPTETGLVMGTPRYMSPEQARGRQVDARSDVWSLGVVLYEMLAGARPFEGETSQDVLASILKDEPPALPADVPAELRTVVECALRKDAGERYPSAASMLEELRAALRALGQPHGGVPVERAAGTDAASGPRGTHPAAMHTRPAGPTDSGAASLTDSGARARTTAHGSVPLFASSAGRRKATVVAAAVLSSLALVAAGLFYFRAAAPAGGAIDSLAVLPFENAGGDPEAEYFSDGVTESIINSLSELPNLKVMSRNSVFRYKGRAAGEALEAARQLGVRAVLTGRVAQRGEQLLVSVELTDAADNTHVWGGQYDRRLADVFAVQQEIARDVSRRLRLRLSGEETQRAARRDADNFEAYQLYLRGRHEWYKFTPDSLARSVDYFNRAVAADPSYALAYAGLANAHSLREHLLGPSSDGYSRAKWAAEKAVELDPSLSEAHWVLGSVRLFNEWDWAGAEASLKRALQLNPNSPEAHTIYGAYLEVMGRFEEANAELRRGLENDPLSLFTHAELAQGYYYAREYDEAIAQAREGLELGPHLLLYHILARALVQKDMQREAVEELKKGLELMRGNPTLLASLGHAYATSGQRDEALKVLAEMEGVAKQHYISPYWIAVVYAGLDDRDRAFELLGRAADERFFMLMWLGVEPRFDRLRSDPRYPALARRIGRPER